MTTVQAVLQQTIQLQQQAAGTIAAQQEKNAQLTDAFIDEQKRNADLLARQNGLQQRIQKLEAQNKDAGERLHGIQTAATVGLLAFGASRLSACTRFGGRMGAWASWAVMGACAAYAAWNLWRAPHEHAK